MRKKSNLKEQLKHGELKIIAETTGYTVQYVSLVLKGQRNQPIIIDTTKRIIDNREQLKEELSQQ